MKIRSAAIQDANQLANLIHFEVFVHRHLDWRQPLEWIGQTPFLVLEINGKIAAALVCPPDPPTVSWIRLLSIASFLDVGNTWESLWVEALKHLKDSREVKWVAAMPLHGWMQSLLTKSGFQNHYNVSMLSWENRDQNEGNLKHPGKIRPLTLDDISTIRKIDELRN